MSYITIIIGITDIHTITSITIITFFLLATCLYQVHKWRDRFQPVFSADPLDYRPKTICYQKTPTVYTVVEFGHWVIQDEERRIAILQKKKTQQLTT